MFSRDLSSIIRPAEVITGGDDFRIKQFIYRDSYDLYGAREIQKIMRYVFSSQAPHQLTCWTDILNPTAPEDHYFHIKGGYMLGVFYKLEEGRDVPTHIFLRRLKNYYGPLDKWKDDIRFPSTTRKYSVCAVVPSTWVAPPRAINDPHVHGVVRYKVSDFYDNGIRFNDFVEYILAPEEKNADEDNANAFTTT